MILSPLHMASDIGESPSDLPTCSYSRRLCQRKPLEGFLYCKNHILEDKSCPYKQCSFVSSKTGKRCTYPTIKTEKESQCIIHQFKLSRARCKAAKIHCQQVNAETLLEDLEHYSTMIYNNSGQTKHGQSDSHSDMLASSDSDEELNKYACGYSWQPDSDSESIDSESEDIFKYAGVLTLEEATRITRDKLIRLQSLYIEQFKWLQHVLSEKRRKYKMAREKERATVQEGSDGRFPLTECPDTQKYIAVRRYHKHHGMEKLLHFKSHERRRLLVETSDAKTRHLSRNTCKYSKCSEKPIPLSRFCIRHIDHDPNQVLFRKCSFAAISNGPLCEVIVPNLYEQNRCSVHSNITDLQAMPVEPLSEQPTEDSEHIVVDDVDPVISQVGME